tara:strand:- start:3468 stop:3698 length:231 start_codon:yes stop_codon:yes gene_type:complete
MLANMKFSFLEQIKKLRAEVPQEYSNARKIKLKYFNRQKQFKSIDELNTHLNKLNDEEFALFTDKMVKILEDNENN